MLCILWSSWLCAPLADFRFYSPVAACAAMTARTGESRIIQCIHDLTDEITTIAVSMTEILEAGPGQQVDSPRVYDPSLSDMRVDFMDSSLGSRPRSVPPPNRKRASSHISTLFSDPSIDIETPKKVRKLEYRHTVNDLHDDIAAVTGSEEPLQCPNCRYIYFTYFEHRGVNFGTTFDRCKECNAGAMLVRIASW